VCHSDLYFTKAHSYVSLHYSVLGSILIVGGLYLVLWGKAKEQAKVLKEDNLDHQRQRGELE
jgi:hypothetical protein